MKLLAAVILAVAFLACDTDPYAVDGGKGDANVCGSCWSMSPDAQYSPCLAWQQCPEYDKEGETCDGQACVYKDKGCATTQDHDCAEND